MPQEQLLFDEHGQITLPLTDGGLQAWLLLAGCFTINVLVWGFSFSFGVLQDYYSSHEPFASNPNGIAAIGTTATGLMYLSMPVFFIVLQRWPVLKLYNIWLGVPVVAIALIGASFAQQVSHLLICQGIIFAVGGNMMVTPTITYLDEWFVRRKGLAIGIMWAGDGAGGVAMPLILEALLTRYSFRTTLRAIAISMIVLIAPFLKFLKPRLPTPAASAARPIDTNFIKNRVFWILQTFNIIQGTGHFLPSNYLPTYAQYIGLDGQLGSLSLVLVNLASVIGCVSVGALMDRAEVTTVIVAISLGAAMSILIIWGLSQTAATLFVFSLLYGLTAGAYSTSWTGMIKEIKRRSVTSDTSVLFGMLAAGRGLGAIVSGPLSEGLVQSYGAKHDGSFGYESSFGSLIIYAGISAFFGGSSWFLRRLGLI